MTFLQFQVIIITIVTMNKSSVFFLLFDFRFLETIIDITKKNDEQNSIYTTYGDDADEKTSFSFLFVEREQDSDI